MIRVGLFVVAIACAGCGSKSEPEDTTPATVKAPSKPIALPAKGSPLDKFHAALAPKWHAVGPSRMADTCNTLPMLNDEAVAMRKAGVPGDLDDGAWSSALSKVEASLGKLAGPCKGTDLTKFEAAFTDVHWAFHEYMDLVVGDHGHGIGDGRGGREGIPK